MTQEDKNLLLKDLCARLPYGVRGERTWTAPVSRSPEKGVFVFDTFDINVLTTGYYDCGEHGFREVRNYSFKPYLFPMSSMTEEQKEDMIKSSCGIGSDKNVFDWFNKNHFDYRGLIPKGLALDATGLNIY